MNYSVREKESQVELYIDQGSDSEELNLKLFNELRRHREAIEASFEGQLEWQELPNSRACRIRKVLAGGYRSNEVEWPETHEAMVSNMIRLDAAVRPYLHSLPEQGTL